MYKNSGLCCYRHMDITSYGIFMSISQIMQPEAVALVTECSIGRLGWIGGFCTAASRGHWLTQLVTLLKATCGEKSLDGPGVQTGPETNASFHPEVWPVEHLLPERNLLARPVHPGNISTQVPAGPKVEPKNRKNLMNIKWNWSKKEAPCSSKEILGLPDPVVIPDCKLKAPLHHLGSSLLWSCSSWSSS